MKRLDRNTGQMINAWLLAIAIGLGVLDLTVLVTKSLPPLPQTPVVSGSVNGVDATRSASSTAPSAPHS